MEDPALSGKYQHSDYVCLSSCPHLASQQHPTPKDLCSDFERLFPSTDLESRAVPRTGAREGTEKNGLGWHQG